MKLTQTFLTSALLATSIFSVQSTAWADTPEQQFQQGFEAVNKGDYQTALKLATFSRTGTCKGSK
ncbi:hypothetical protein [Haemophilus haemolyticus]|uniref:hypothetical protein n=1 Tax=Haemophilus haemolyticus TaxID=726 RepID=UPI001EFD50A6|nr:hypothetical protein [Haemophilus haemolyticus]